jgi:phosphoribosylformylglycinamidine (FGAM) synthase PurS component
MVQKQKLFTLNSENQDFQDIPETVEELECSKFFENPVKIEG